MPFLDQSAIAFQNMEENVDLIHRSGRRQSTLTTSNPNNNSLPIDCILTYHYDDNKHSDSDNKNNNSSQRRMSPSERRRRFEKYLTNQQHLVVEHVVRTK